LGAAAPSVAGAGNGQDKGREAGRNENTLHISNSLDEQLKQKTQSLSDHEVINRRLAQC
jgi:hypothetical protein